MTILQVLFASLTVGVFSASAQIEDQNIQLQVLEKSITDSTFIFGKWTENGGTETHLKFLGQLTTKNGHTFKVVNSILFWGLSQRATPRILIFNDQNQYIGNYCMTTIYDLPIMLKDGKMIFENTDDNCNRNLITTVSLNNGIPKQFFRKCKDKSGDIFSFSSE